MDEKHEGLIPRARQAPVVDEKSKFQKNIGLISFLGMLAAPLVFWIAHGASGDIVVTFYMILVYFLVIYSLSLKAKRISQSTVDKKLAVATYVIGRIIIAIVASVAILLFVISMFSART